MAGAARARAAGRAVGHARPRAGRCGSRRCSSRLRRPGAHGHHDGGESVCHDDDGGGGHVRHADLTCASGALETGPVLPALMPDPVGPVPLAFGGHGSGAAALEDGRAPPTPAEPQLLRI
ncbi:DUF6153 family protein [Streptomyces sp. NPDC001275]